MNDKKLNWPLIIAALFCVVFWVVVIIVAF